MPPCNEGLLTANRIRQLELHPVVGPVDTGQLLEIHRRIFQDLPHHGPGQWRPDAPHHIKARALETLGARYYVPYAPRWEVPDGLSRTLTPALLPELAHLPQPALAQRLAALYADLDYWHPFAEGNSRTLRVFTRQIARQLGYVLDWGGSNADNRARDILYVARDRAVFQRAFPNLSAERAMTTTNRIEFEAYMMMQQFRSLSSLEELLKTWVQPDKKHRQDRETEAER